MFIASFRLKSFVQNAICQVYELFDFGGMHPVREIRKRALAQTVEYVEQNMMSAIGVYTPRQALDVALTHVAVDGHFVEFGVFKGGTIRYIAAKYPRRTIHGFDSFEGLPGAWSGTMMDKGTFALGGNLPKVPHNVSLHKGWFNATLPGWLEQFPGQVAFVHIDCDIYESTKSIFDYLGPRLLPGTVIAFDEYFGYPNWRNHEFKAFQEFVEKFKVKYEYLVYSRIQVALKILSVGE
jgi:methyltransferase family protein